MKKILFLFLLSIAAYGQADFPEGVQISGGQPTTTTDPYITTTGATGLQGKVTPEEIPLTIIPPTTHYTPVTPNLKGHFQGLDNAIGNIPLTTAGNTTRVWFTGDATTITAGTFYLTNPSNKGTVANVSQSVTNDDNQKKYFTQDLIGQPFATATFFPPGVYAGNLSASTTPNSAQQRFTIELYKCNNAGTPIASGVSGAPVGDLGVTVILILDSGLLTLADGSVTNVPVSASLASQFSIGVGERIRYHVSAEKVGTASSNITESVWYGNSFNSFIDVPTPITSSGVTNVSTVTGASVTAALDVLNTGKANIAGGNTFTGIQSFGNQVKFNDGTVASPSITFYGTELDDDTGFNHDQDGEIEIVVNGIRTGEFRPFMYNFYVPTLTTSISTSSNSDSVGLSMSNGGNSLNYNGINFKGVSATDMYFGRQAGVGVDDLVIRNSSSELVRFGASGVIKISNLSGTDDAIVLAESDGKLKRGAVQPKKYVALISQSGTSAPVATVLENTLGGTVTWTRSATGVYHATTTSIFTSSKTFFLDKITNGSSENKRLNTLYVSSSDIQYASFDSAGALSDGVMLNTPVEIRVYP